MSDFFNQVDTALQKKLNSKNDSHINQSAWIRMTSGYEFKKLHSSNIKYDKNNYYRPKSSIKSLTSKYLTEEGGIRETTIEWVATSNKELEELGQYFLTPGILVLIEWGRGNSYLSYNNDYEGIADTIDVVDLFQKRSRNRNFNYSAALGKILNFEINLNDDGTYNCSTVITNMGASVYGVDLDHEFSVKDTSTKLKTLKELFSNNGGFHNYILNKYNNARGTDYLVDGENQYVSLGAFTDYLNQSYILKAGKGKIFEFDISDVALVMPKELKSTNLSICLLPNSTHYGLTKFTVLRATMVNIKVIENAFQNSNKLINALTTIFHSISSAVNNYWKFTLVINDKNKLVVFDEHSMISKEKITPFVMNYYNNSYIKNVNLSMNLNETQGMSSIFAAHTTDSSVSKINGVTDVFPSIWNYSKKVMKDNFMTEMKLSKSDEKTDENIKKDENVTKVFKYYSETYNDKFSDELKLKYLFGYSENPDGYSDKVKFDLYMFGSIKDKSTNYLKNMKLPLNLSVDLEGVAGFRIRNLFTINVLPTIYNNQGSFVISGLSETIDEGMSWSLTIDSYYKFN